MVTIIIPVYNAEKYIDRCLVSVANQTYKDFECICVDDGSTDKSSSIIRNLSQEDSRFFYYYQVNQGPSVARNTGLEKAKGDYVLFIDSDDTILPRYIENMVTRIEETMADVCCCGYINFDGNKYIKINDYTVTGTPTRELFLQCLFSGTGGTVCSKLFRSCVIAEFNIRFDRRFSMCEDQLFALQFFCNCQRFTSINRCDYIYNRGSNGLTKKTSIEQWHQQFDLLDLMVSIMCSAKIDGVIVENCYEKKIKNILLGLFLNAAKIGENRIREMLNDSRVISSLNAIQIRNKSDMKWMLPLKMRLYPIIELVYKGDGGIRDK